MELKKNIISMFAFLMACMIISAPVFGLEDIQVSSDPILVPGHPLYFMKQISEGLKYTFTFNKEKKFALQQEFILERQREYLVLEKRGDTKNMLKMQQQLQTHNIISANLRTRVGTCDGNC